MRAISLFLLLLSFCCFAVERQLEYRLSAVDTAAIMRSGEWNFSGCSVKGSKHGLSTTVYGDSLVGEYADGFREWFALRDDTLYYAGEECRDYLLSPSSLRPTWVFPRRQGDYREFSFEGAGRRFSRYGYSESAVISTEVGATGNLVVFFEDTIRNVTVTRECKRVPEYERTVFRWYVDGSCLPIAVQRMERRFDYEYECSTLYLMAPEDLAVLIEELADGANVLEAQKELIEYALQNADVGYGNGVVSITMPVPGDVSFVLTVDILDVVGFLYKHEEVLADGASGVTIPVGDLAPREYIVALSCSSVPQAQVRSYIIIR